MINGEVDIGDNGQPGRGAVARFILLPKSVRRRQEVVVGKDEFGDIRVLPVRYINPIRPPYPKAPLGERQVIAATKSPLIYLWIPLFLIVPAGLALATWLSKQAADPDAPKLLHHWQIAPIVFLLTLVIMYGWYLHWWANVWYITPHQITKRRSWFWAEKEWSVVPNDIHGLTEKVWFPKLLFGRLLGFGSIIIRSAGKEWRIHNVANYTRIMEAAESTNLEPDKAASRNVALARQQLVMDQRVVEELRSIHELLQNSGQINTVGLIREVAELRERTDTLMEAVSILLALLRLEPARISEIFGDDLVQRLRNISVLPPS